MVKLIIAILIILVVFVPWKRLKKSLVVDAKDTNIPDACSDCNRGSCQNCRLQWLSKEQANTYADVITQQAIADGTTVYDTRLQK